MSDHHTCWHDKRTIIDELNRNYPVYINLMAETEHINALKKSISFIETDYKGREKLNIIDIGCGTAQISLLFDKTQWEYEGCDLAHILQYCAQKWHPENVYYPFEAENSHYHFLKNYDVVLMNAFIDVMENPLIILDKVLSNAKKYAILHRQEISQTKPTYVTENPSYGGITFHSIINKNDFLRLLKEHNFEISINNNCGFNNWENKGDSILLQKNG